MKFLSEDQEVNETVVSSVKLKQYNAVRDGKFRAFVDITFNGCITLKNFKLYEDDDGSYSMLLPGIMFLPQIIITEKLYDSILMKTVALVKLTNLPVK